jgi:hypothetical protein
MLVERPFLHAKRHEAGNLSEGKTDGKGEPVPARSIGSNDGLEGCLNSECTCPERTRAAAEETPKGESSGGRLLLGVVMRE